MTETRTTLNDNIARFRKAAGLTQEALGKRVGVSTQAVSKWEGGGMPDPALLPALADALGTTIDSLFGRDGGAYKPMEELLDAEIANTPQEKRLQRIDTLCWAMFQSVMCHETLYGHSVSDIVRGLQFAQEQRDNYLPFYRSKEGLQMFSLAGNIPFYLLMPEPKQGYHAMLYNTESYERLFSLLARPNRFRVLVYLECVERGFTPGYLGKQLGITAREAEESLEDLRDHALCYRQELDTEEGLQKIYGKRDNLNLLPLLLTAGFLMNDPMDVIQFDVRRGPMLAGTLGEGNPKGKWEPEHASDFHTDFNG